MKKVSVIAPVAHIFAAYWKADWRTFILVALAVALSGVASVLAPYTFSRLVDHLSSGGSMQLLAWGFVLYAVLVGLNAGLQHVIRFLSFMSSENLGFIASTEFFERLLRKSSAFFVEHNPVEIQNAASGGRAALTTLAQIVLIVLVPGAVQIAMTLATLGVLINAEIVVIVVAYGTVFVGVTVIANRRSQPFLDAAVQAGQENARFVGNAINAMETLRHFNSRDWMSARFTQKAGEVRDNWRAFVMRRLAFVLLLGLGLAVQLAVSFFLLLPRYEAGAVSIGAVVLFNMLVLQLNFPFEMLGHAIDDVIRARASLTPLATLWQAPEEPRNDGTQPAFTLAEGRLEFRKVSYTYDNGRGVSDISFVAERGAITYLTGETGAGKSTVFRLALRSIEPAAGNITVDGRPMTDITREDWYRAVAVVPQDVVLLNESLADNILLGRAQDEASLKAVAEKAAILPFISGLPEGFETNVGERGLKLSGGERQRIAIARALYGEPAILFLDEASSALDERTERDIMDHVRALSHQVTVLAITHRKAVIAASDKVVALDVLAA